jgi:hypothetical protein
MRDSTRAYICMVSSRPNIHHYFRFSAGINPLLTNSELYVLLKFMNFARSLKSLRGIVSVLLIPTGLNFNWAIEKPAGFLFLAAFRISNGRGLIWPRNEQI